MAKNHNLSGGLFPGSSRKPQPLTIKETPLSAQFAEYLDRRHIYNDRLNSGMAKRGKYVIRLCKPGTPDRFAIVRGFIVFIEVKMLGKEPTADQLTRHQELRASGAHVIVADSLESFIKQFTAFERLLNTHLSLVTASNF